MSQHCLAHGSHRTGNGLRDHESEIEKSSLVTEMAILIKC
jgi:hypothetical protein